MRFRVNIDELPEEFEAETLQDAEKFVMNHIAIEGIGDLY